MPKFDRNRHNRLHGRTVARRDCWCSGCIEWREATREWHRKHLQDVDKDTKVEIEESLKREPEDK